MLKDTEALGTMLYARRQAIIRARYICWMNSNDWGDYTLKLV